MGTEPHGGLMSDYNCAEAEMHFKNEGVWLSAQEKIRVAGGANSKNEIANKRGWTQIKTTNPNGQEWWDWADHGFFSTPVYLRLNSYFNLP